jgi:DHA1 family bicyclomycin/chloramphenicol resistance-like MFS transporter
VPLALVALLAALSTISPFATDTYLPSLSAVGDSLHSAPLQVQQTLSAYMFGLGLMSLWHGSISDAVGRRPVIISALAVFTAASAACALAQSLPVLIGARLLQGLSGGAGMVISRAVVRDTVTGPSAQRLMSQVMLMFGIAPAIGPILGGWLHEWFGWRSVFWFMFALGATLFLWVSLGLPETLPRAQRHSLHPVQMAGRYLRVLRSPAFYALSITTAFSFQVFMQYIGASTPFLKEQLQLGDTQFGYFFIPGVAGYMLGSGLSGRLAGRIAPVRAVAAGLALMLASALFNVLYHAFFPPGVLASIGPITVACVGLAMLAPATQLMVLDLFPDMRGLAASCQVFVQIMVGAVDLAFVSIALASSTFSLALGLLGWTLAAIASWLIFLRLRHY